MIAKFCHYIHALDVRLFQLYELSLMRDHGSPFDRRFRRRLWRKPGETEDWVNLARFIRPAERVLLVDIGANVGNFTADFLSFYKTGRSICFEPVAKTHEFLSARYMGNGRVETQRIALSDRDGSAEMHVYPDNRLSTLTQYTEDANEHYQTSAMVIEETACRRLDSLQISRKDGEKLFIKIDVQGFEMEVIRGGIETLREADVVLIECSFADEYEGKEPSFSPICAALRECDLYPIVFQDYGRSVSNYAFERDVLFVKRSLLSEIWLRNYPHINDPHSASPAVRD